MALTVSVLVMPSKMLRLYRFFLVVIFLISLFLLVSLSNQFLGVRSWALFVVGLLLIPVVIQWTKFGKDVFELRIDEDGFVHKTSNSAVLDSLHRYSIDEGVPVVVWALFVLMHIRDEMGRGHRVLICRDAVCEDGFRQLRAVLLSLAHKRQGLMQHKNDISEGNF